MRDHNYAFSSWEIERLKGKIELNSTLIHVDSHLDDLPEAIEIVGILDKINSFEEAIKLGEKFDYSRGTSPDRIYMHIDNFIWPAIMRNTVGNVIYISDDSKTELNKKKLRLEIEKDPKNDKPIVRKLFENLLRYDKNISRLKSIEDFEQSINDFLLNLELSKTILDIDLDYFNDSDSFDSNPKLRSEEQIIKNLQYLKQLTNWDVITVALSPEYCGGEEACNYLLDLFLTSFKIDKEELIDW